MNVAALLDLAAEQGITRNSLKKWRKRGKVPSKYHLTLVEAAQKRGLRLTRGDFEFSPITVRPKVKASTGRKRAA